MDNCRQVLDEVLDEVDFSGLKSLVLRLYICADIYIEIRSFVRELGVEDEEFIGRFGSVEDIENRLMTVEAAVDYLHDIVEQSIRWRSRKSHENGNFVVRDARRYIDENYMSSGLSLTSVAEAVGISPA